MEFKNHTKQEVAAIAAECYRQITALTPMTVFFSWGVSKVRYMEYKGMASLVMNVQGFLHKGLVVVALDEGSDTYIVYCLDDKLNEVNAQEDVYFDQLGDVIDRMVERDQKFYGKKI